MSVGRSEVMYFVCGRCAGERCLAVSVAITVGEATKPFSDKISELASSLKAGNGLDVGVQMGSVISPASKKRIGNLINAGVRDGGKVLLERRRNGNGASDAFLNPTILSDIQSNNKLNDTEIFGPMLSMKSVADLDEAITTISKSGFGNAASTFTSNGNHARKFRYEVPAGNIGVNIGVAAPRLQWMEGQLSRCSAWTRPRRHRFLHRQKGCHRALAERMVTQVLEGSKVLQAFDRTTRKESIEKITNESFSEIRRR
jgi:acyl-CoA reductase-like NAD-dependent aldehyde dehydrogenase